MPVTRFKATFDHDCQAAFQSQLQGLGKQMPSQGATIPQVIQQDFEPRRVAQPCTRQPQGREDRLYNSLEHCLPALEMFVEGRAPNSGGLDQIRRSDGRIALIGHQPDQGVRDRLSRPLATAVSLRRVVMLHRASLTD